MVKRISSKSKVKRLSLPRSTIAGNNVQASRIARGRSWKWDINTAWITGEASPGAICYDSTYLYWVAGTTIRRAPIGGGTPVTLVSGLSNASYGIAVDGTYLYYSIMVGGVIGRVAKGGGTPSTIISGLLAPSGIAVNTNYIYWASYGNAVTGYIGRANIDGSNPAPLVSAQASVFDMAIDSNSVYWANWSVANSTIRKAAITGGSVSTLVTGIASTLTLCVYESRLYFNGGSSIYERVSPDYRLIAALSNTPYGLACYDNCLYGCITTTGNIARGMRTYE